MHVIFGVSAVMMGIATIWMLAADHNREWKDWQLKDRKKDAWMLGSRRDSLAAQYAAQMSELRGRHPAARQRGDRRRKWSTQFKARVAEDDARRERSAAIRRRSSQRDRERPAVRSARRARERAQTPPTSRAAEARDAADANERRRSRPRLAAAEDDAIKARQAVLAEMDKFVREAQRRENELVGTKKAVNGRAHRGGQRAGHQGRRGRRAERRSNEVQIASTSSIAELGDADRADRRRQRLPHGSRGDRRRGRRRESGAGQSRSTR